jgi:uncharacterized protein YecE (DUF72 family)
MGKIRAGMAGWVFEDWRGGQFYPKGLKQKEELHFASRAVTAIEINSTFYSNQKATSFSAWAAQTPPGFQFTVKGPQLVTHIKKLKDVEVPLANFFASGLFALGDRLGPVCWQLPANLSFSADRIESFLDLLPRTPRAALALAKKHDERIGSPWLTLDGVTEIRHALEVRHRSFAEPAFIDLLRARNVALVVADTSDWPYVDQTADFSYLRLQGAPGADHYEPAQIDEWANRLKSWSGGRPAGGETVGPPDIPGKSRDVFCYFVSTDKPNAPRNALAVMDRLGIASYAG